MAATREKPPLEAIDSNSKKHRISSRGQQRKAKILSAATRLFLSEGYGETSIDAIVEKSGGSKATLYSYYPTKADLFRAVVDSIVTKKYRLWRFAAAAPSCSRMLAGAAPCNCARATPC